MDRLRRRSNPERAEWRACLQCGNRYQAANHGYKVNWCSPACEHASMRSQRDELETSWIKARWMLR